MAKITPIKVPVEIVVDDAQLAKLREASSLRGGRGGFGGSGARSASARGSFGGRPPIIDPDAVIAANTPGVAAGDPFAVSRVNAAMAQKRAAQRAYNAVSPPSPRDAFMRTRWTNVGGKLVGSPLGRDLRTVAGLMGMVPGAEGVASAAGAVSANGAAALPVIALVAAMVALKRSIDLNRQALTLSLRNGGTTGQALAAQNIANAIGSAGPDNLSSAGGIKGALFSKYGVNPVRGYFGGINNTADYYKIAERFIGMDPEQARREAIGLGDPGLAKFAEMSPHVARQVIEDGKRSGNGNRRATADLEGGKAYFGNRINKYMASGDWAWDLQTAFLWSPIKRMMTNGGGGQSQAKRIADKMDMAADKMVEAAQRMNQGYFGNAAGGARRSTPGHFNPSLDPQGLNSIGRPLF